MLTKERLLLFSGAHIFKISGECYYENTFERTLSILQSLYFDSTLFHGCLQPQSKQQLEVIFLVSEEERGLNNTIFLIQHSLFYLQ